MGKALLIFAQLVLASFMCDDGLGLPRRVVVDAVAWIRRCWIYSSVASWGRVCIGVVGTGLDLHTGDLTSTIPCTERYRVVLCNAIPATPHKNVQNTVN